MSLNGKVAIVTGSGAGLGLAYALRTLKGQEPMGFADEVQAALADETLQPDVATQPPVVEKPTTDRPTTQGEHN